MGWLQHRYAQPQGKLWAGCKACARTCVWRTLMRPMDSMVVCMSAFFWLRDRLSGRRRLAVMFRVSHTVRDGRNASVCTGVQESSASEAQVRPALGQAQAEFGCPGPLSDDKQILV